MADPDRLGLLAALAVALAAAVPDIRERRIPNALVLAGLLAVTALAVAGGRWPDALAGGALAATLLALPRLVAPAAVGSGDIKLAGVVGIGVGVTGVIVVVGLAVAAAGIMLAVRAARWSLARGRPLPFAPYLALGVAGHAAVVLSVGAA